MMNPLFSVHKRSSTTVSEFRRNLRASDASYRMTLVLIPGFILCLLLGVQPAAGQQKPDAQLLALINQIKIIDNHCHDLPARDVKYTETEVTDPLGTSPSFAEARLRETNPEWIEAWQALYSYRQQDTSQEHVRELFKSKQRLMREKGETYPAWVLDQIGIEVALVNAPQLGLGQTAPRFRWVPLASCFPLSIRTQPAMFSADGKR